MIQINDSKFFMNEDDEDKLYKRFNTILKNNTQYFDVLVGYFMVSGFYRVYESMKDVEKIRIIVGLNIDKKTSNLISQSKIQTLEHKKFEDKLKKEFENSENISEIKKSSEIFIEWLKSGKLEIRKFKDRKIHAKIYIFRKNTIISDENFGSLITGSSNFSESGFNLNTEFNVELKDYPDVKYALNKFEDLWKNTEDLKDFYIDVLQQKTWLKNDITPYEIYLKTLYEFYYKEINLDLEDTSDIFLDNSYKHLKYQSDAAIQANKILYKYNGVFISDVVGLGKTYIACMLANLNKDKTIIVICPPILIPSWEQILDKFKINCKIISIGKLEVVSDYVYDIVFIDESHRFKNEKSKRYNLLHEICLNKKVVLISATPMNNNFKDIINQIYLFQPKHNSNIPNIKNLENYISNLDKNLKKLKNDPEKYEDEQKNISINIRDKILRYIMIRRTRQEITKFYIEDIKAQNITFPKVSDPKSINYTFNDKTNILFNETIKIIKDKFKFAKYQPQKYLLKANKTSESNIKGFMKCLIIKRLESSFYAFTLTLERLKNKYIEFIENFENGNVEINLKDEIDNLKDEINIDEYNFDNKNNFSKEDFSLKFIKNLKSDLKYLEYLHKEWSDVKTDFKFEEFKIHLENDEILKQKKIIIFTESKETADFLNLELSKIYNVIMYHGSSKKNVYQDIRKNFDPNIDIKDQLNNYQILITTDAMSEGVNLHRASIIINYDLPWNPTRIMQRLGRIDRIGTKHEEIFIFNLFPTDETNKELPIKEKILQKLKIFCDVLGGDSKYLSNDDEEIKNHNLYENLSKLNYDVEIDNDKDLTYLKFLRNLRDEDKNLFEKIKRLPLKCSSSKIIDSDKVSNNSTATITFLKSKILKTFFITNSLDEKTEEIDFYDAIKFIECDKNEKKINIDEIYFNFLEKNKQKFNNSQNKIIKQTKIYTPIENVCKRKLRRIIVSNKNLDDNIKKQITNLIDSIENGNLTDNIIHIIYKQETKDILEKISKNYLNYNNKNNKNDENDEKEETKIILSMYLKKI